MAQVAKLSQQMGPAQQVAANPVTQQMGPAKPVTYQMGPAKPVT